MLKIAFFLYFQLPQIEVLAEVRYNELICNNRLRATLLLGGY